jgi:thiol-disulfide isomerase/thioredoxin
MAGRDVVARAGAALLVLLAIATTLTAAEGLAVATAAAAPESAAPEAAAPEAAAATAIARQAIAAPLEFSIEDTTCARHTRGEWSHARAVVLFFIGTDCPLSSQYVPEMNRLAAEYGPRGALFYAIATDATVAASETRQYVEAFALYLPMLLDAAGVLVRHTGATVTPEVAVLSPDGALLYLGRIDNRMEDFGTHRYAPTQFDLRDALGAVLSGHAVPHAKTAAVGCFIPAPPRTEPQP